MTFRNPVTALPGIQLLGQGIVVAGKFTTTVLSVVGLPSLLIAPITITGAPNFVQVTIAWYADVAKTISLGSEKHWINIAGTTSPLVQNPTPLLLTQCKGPYCVVTRGGTNGSLTVYSSTVPVVGYQRLDSSLFTSENYAGDKSTTIPANISSAGDTLIGFAGRATLTAVAAVSSDPGNVGTDTLTATFVLKDPAGNTLGTVSPAPLVTGAAGVTVYTAPIALPALPPGGISFELDLTFSVAAPSASRSYSVLTYVY